MSNLLKIRRIPNPEHGRHVIMPGSFAAVEALHLVVQLAAKVNRQGGLAGRNFRPKHEAGRFLPRIELYVLGGELLVAERNRRRAELQVQCVERDAIRCFHDLMRRGKKHISVVR